MWVRMYFNDILFEVINDSDELGSVHTMIVRLIYQKLV